MFKYYSSKNFKKPLWTQSFKKFITDSHESLIQTSWGKSFSQIMGSQKGDYTQGKGKEK